MLRRVVLLAAATALLAVVLLAIPLGVLIERSYIKDERLELEQEATSTAATLTGDLTAGPSGKAGEIRFSVFDIAGRRLSGTASESVASLVRAALAGREESATAADSISVAAPVSDGDHVTGAVVLSSGLGPAHSRAITAWLWLAAMCLAAVAISALVARWIAGVLAAPIGRLTDTARRMGAGELTARATPSGIAEVDTLGAVLNDSAEQIQRMLTRERAFSAEVSHQLRTPLSGLRLELEAAERGGAGLSGEAAAAGSLSRALAEVDRVEATIAEVIGLARDLRTAQTVALAPVLAQVASRWHGHLAAANRPLRVVTELGLPDRVAISPAAISQILDVLLDNANQHGRGAVTVHARAEGGTVRLDVSDEGRLSVEPWVLFQDRDLGSSHGIGLPYARRLAEAEGARLVVLSHTPTTFSLVASDG